LARGGGQDVRAALLEAGLRTENGGDGLFVAILKTADVEKEIIVVDRPGWHRIAGVSDAIFVSPAGTNTGAPKELHLELAQNPRTTTPCQAGSMDGWRRAVSAACTVGKCPHWPLSVSAGFAGPIVALAGLDTNGISLSGFTRGGKTTGQKLAVSVWTSPKLGEGLLQSMRTTEMPRKP
jgi:uncharacterized protein (DUF927 family)